MCPLIHLGHTDLLKGHLGPHNRIEKLRDWFPFPKMHAEVWAFGQQYPQCQQASSWCPHPHSALYNRGQEHACGCKVCGGQQKVKETANQSGISYSLPSVNSTGSRKWCRTRCTWATLPGSCLSAAILSSEGNHTLPRDKYSLQFFKLNFFLLLPASRLSVFIPHIMK